MRSMAVAAAAAAAAAYEQPCHRAALCSNPTNASCLLARALLLVLPVPPGPEDPGMSMGATLT